MKVFNYSSELKTIEQAKWYLDFFFDGFKYSSKWEGEYYNLLSINWIHFLPTDEVYNKILKAKAIRICGIDKRSFVNTDVSYNFTSTPWVFIEYKEIRISNFSSSPKGETEEKKKFLESIDENSILDIYFEIERTQDKIMFNSNKKVFKPLMWLRFLKYKLNKKIRKSKKIIKK